MKGINHRVLNRGFFYRSWKYFRDGYSLYLHFPIGLISFLTVTFYLLVENIPMLQFLIPNMTVYTLIALIVFIPSGVFLGWLHMRYSKIFAVESVLMLESNPLYVHANMVQMELSLDLYAKLNLQPPQSFLELYTYWKRLDEKSGWKPNK